jgi:hypothetical protein
MSTKRSGLSSIPNSQRDLSKNFPSSLRLRISTLPQPNFTSLTQAQQRVYENSRKFYDSDMKYYTIQSNQLKEARIFITTTRSDSVREWLVKLKRNTEPTNGQLIQKAVDEYNAVLWTKPTGTRVGNWIKQWEYAMTKGERYGIPQLMNGQWLRDLATAIRPLSDVLYNKYVDQADDPEKSMASEYIEVGKKLRQALDHSKGAPLRTARGGAFAADFAGTGSIDSYPDVAIILYKVERIETRRYTAAKGQAHNRSKRRCLLPKGRVPYNAQRVE